MSSQLENKVKEIYSSGHESWGKASIYYLDSLKDGTCSVENIIRERNFKSVLDYGCGKSTVVDNLQTKFPEVEFSKYDPYINEYSCPLSKLYEFVLCHMVIHLFDRNEFQIILTKLAEITSKELFIAFVVDRDKVNQRLTFYENQFTKYFADIEKTGHKEIRIGDWPVHLQQYRNHLDKRIYISYLLKHSKI